MEGSESKWPSEFSGTIEDIRRRYDSLGEPDEEPKEPEPEVIKRRMK